MTHLQGAIIGFGNIAELGHWPTYAQASDAHLTAIVDPSPARQAAAKKLDPEIHCYDNVEDLFRTERLDFVDICTPPASHAPLALMAIERDCHVLCEKPLSMKTSEYEALAKASRRSGKTVFTVHNWKYAPIFQKAFEVIRQGRIGPVWHVDVFTLRNSHCKGAAQGAAGSSGDSEDWRKDPSIAGGGILVDHGWHAFYLMLNLVQAEPLNVLSKMMMDKENPNSLEEAVQALVQFPAADGYVHLTWHAPIRRNSVVVQGQNGTLLLDDNRILLSAHDGQKQEFNFESALSAGSHHADWFQQLWPDFVEEVRNPAKRGTNLKEAGWCLALMSSAYDSSLHGFTERPVLFPGTPKPTPAMV